MANVRRVVKNGKQICSLCNQMKPLDMFYKNKAYVNGHEGQCKDCIRNKHGDYYATDSYKKRNRERMRLYGLQPEEYRVLLEKQNSLCAICGRPQRSYFVRTKDGRKHYLTSLTVDHNHRTKEIRGLLCRNCNLAIGLFEDNPKILQSAIQYLCV